jgi:putative pyrroloquinoline-quinone binding quinoprotein
MTKITGTNQYSAMTEAPPSRPLRRIGAVVRHHAPWRSLAAFSLLGLATSLALPASGALNATPAVAVANTIGITPVWSENVLPDGSQPIAESSPNIANLAGGPAVVVGDRAGHVYALNLATGNEVPGWPVSTSGVPVDSTPSVADTTGNGLDSVFVGVGTAANASEGGYMAINPQGGTQWFTNVDNPSTDNNPAHAVQASLAVGNLEGGTDVVAGSLGEVAQAMSASTGGILPGYPWFQADSSFATPAIADIYGNGQNDVIEAGDSTAGVAYGQTYSNGGHLRVVLPTGNAFQGNPGGGVVCQYNTTQTMDSSPAVGQFLAGNAVGIAFGTGSYFPGASMTDDLTALNSHCAAQWTDKLDGLTSSSPALADVEGNGQLQVVEGTQAGTVWALNGSNGATLWHTSVGNPVIGSVVTADLTGAGYQDVLVPTTEGLQILDGRSGQIVDTLATTTGLQNSPLVTDDADGNIGITIAGYDTSAGNQGIVEHFEVTRSNGSAVNEAGAWPMFHHDPQLTGSAGVPAPVVQVPCTAPSGTPYGYDMAASDGGIFTFGDLPFCGSTGNLVLAAPVVGMALTHDAGGYWEVASDGGIFAFDDAGYYGSMGGKPLAKPIVGMAATNTGKGYWLVASDGGIFAFGDAKFYGSMGGHPLDKPIVGMATTPDGGGYWEVASDGGIFAFGDAKFYGSMGAHHLNKPIVGIAADDATGGYWEVASDGGIFAFNAPFLGSTGNIRLNKPVVGMQALPDGKGYRFVASDGGIFTYGASFYGSTGAIHLTKPVVGMSGF